MARDLIPYLAMLACSLLLDASVQPRRKRMWQWQGLVLHLLSMTAAYGLLLSVSGNVAVAAVLVIAIMALFAATSNAKHAMLGEPLIFSDLALIAALVRHPRFYFTAISTGQRRLLATVMAVLPLMIAWLFVPRLAPHTWGLVSFCAAAGALLFLVGSGPFRVLTPVPDVEGDLERFGLIATLLLYWSRWREALDPPRCAALLRVGAEGDLEDHHSPELIVIVQCESFADPVELTGDPQYLLTGLSAARDAAWQWGDLGVSGFGAYTMRTEYGVLFGRSEAALGFRRFDPFLTAHGETSYALSKRLNDCGYHSTFVHPHDMRFYGRDRLMPAIGFDTLIGEESFAPVSPDQGRYVDDRSVGASIGDIIDKATERTLIYAVTMENHGPWDKDRIPGSTGGMNAYACHLQSSDDMLQGLVGRLSGAGRTALLVFFGDHRPSIPGVTGPGGARHTPYVMLRFSAEGQLVTGENRRANLSPDELHHAILNCVQTSSAP